MDEQGMQSKSADAGVDVNPPGTDDERRERFLARAAARGNRPNKGEDDRMLKTFVEEGG